MHWLLYEVVESVEDDVDVLRVRALVEDRVEVDMDVRVVADERAKVELLVPGAHSVALHEPVRVVAREARLDEREQQPLREVEAVRCVEVSAHPPRMDDEPFDEPG